MIHTNRESERDTRIHRHRQRDTDTDTQTHRHTETQTQTHTHTDRQTVCIHTHTHTLEEDTYSVNVYFPPDYFFYRNPPNVYIRSLSLNPPCKTPWKEGVSPSNTLSPLGHFAPSPALPHLRKRHVLWTCIFCPIDFWIDNIPTNSSKVCTRSLIFNLTDAKTSLCERGNIPSHTLPPLCRFVPSPANPDLRKRSGSSLDR